MKGKYTVLFLCFIVLSSFKVLAQEDTIRLKEKQQQLFGIDSLKVKRNSGENISVSTDLGDLNKFLLLNDEVTFKLSHRKSKSFFNSSYSHYILPAALISYGVFAHANKSLREIDLSTNNEVGEHIYQHIPYDDYMQFAPAVGVYGFDLIGLKAKHNFRDRTIIMATSFLIMGTMVQVMKSSTHVLRPDGSNLKSFPSGHTATAFVGAHILFKEYKDTSPWIGVGGYAVALATGTLRVMNKKHWVSDVAAGAGIGILSAELGYALLPVCHKIFGIKDKTKSLVILPTATTNSFGLGLVYHF